MPSFQNVGGDAYKPGLERIESFCKLLGEPHLSYPTIHIAGTNGKGSTSNMLASVLHSSGYRVGLFTSPHLRDFRERMRVDGEMISESEVVEFVATHREEMERMGLSFFEMTAAMAFDFFARQGVDVAVIECGLGGRLDATNIVLPELSIITNIGLDHTQYLGDSLPKIAAEKGGIIKPNRDVVIGERGVEYTDVFVEIARERGCEILFAEDHYQYVSHEQSSDYQIVTLDKCTFKLDLQGEYQQRNLVTLLTAVERLNQIGRFKIDQDSLQRGLSSVMSQMRLEGRWQRLSTNPLTICDTGHNTHGLMEVAAQLKRQSYRELYCVIGLSRDKDLRHILQLFPSDAHFIFTRPKVERAFTGEEIAVVAQELGLRCEVVPNVREAMQKAQKIATSDDLIFVGGSNFVVAEIL